MTRLFLATITVVSALAAVPHIVKAQKPTLKKVPVPKYNQVYVKIILPTDQEIRDKDRPVVESWIAEHLKKHKQSKFTAATAWVRVIDDWREATELWNGNLDGKGWACSVGGYIVDRVDGRIKVCLNGWSPSGSAITVSLRDEPGSREFAAVEDLKAEQGPPYVVVLIGPPSE